MLLEGKKILVLGVANKSSIAWGITEALRKNGAQVALTYLNEAIEKRVRPLAEEVGAEHVYNCNVQDDKSIGDMYGQIKEDWGSIDGIVHSVAYADKKEMENPFSQTSREGFLQALDISAYSLIAVTRGALPIMNEGGSILTLSYLGAERVIRNYNVMGVAKAALESSVRYLASDLGEKNIRVNALSAGPIRTLAASGIPEFKRLLSQFAAISPLKRNVTLEDVGNTAMYLMSPLASGVTGETVYVDCGFNRMGAV